MELSTINILTSDFESASKKTGEDIEFWFARDLQYLLGYAKWDNFKNVILKAKTACEVSGNNIIDHFPDVGKMVEIGSGATKEIDDIMLTRYACYLIAQNGDSKKELSQVIYEQTSSDKNFGIIRSKGDQALFNHNTAQMKAKWDIPNTKPLADFLPTILLKAKDFATEITIYNAKENTMSYEQQISNEHITNNKAVRETLISRGITPENVKPSEDIKKVQRKLNSETKKALKTKDKLQGDTE